LPRHQNLELPGFRASALLSGLNRELIRCHSPLDHKSSFFLVPRVIPTSTPILLHPPQQDVVLFVGYPCLGKSTFFRQHFQPEGYIHINQDTLKTREKCIRALEETLKAGKSCVVGQSLPLLNESTLTKQHLDNTNRNVTTRKHYIDLCGTLKVPIRCASYLDCYVSEHISIYCYSDVFCSPIQSN